MESILKWSANWIWQTLRIFADLLALGASYNLAVVMMFTILSEFHLVNKHIEHPGRTMPADFGGYVFLTSFHMSSHCLPCVESNPSPSIMVTSEPSYCTCQHRICFFFSPFSTVLAMNCALSEPEKRESSSKFVIAWTVHYFTTTRFYNSFLHNHFLSEGKWRQLHKALCSTPCLPKHLLNIRLIWMHTAHRMTILCFQKPKLSCSVGGFYWNRLSTCKTWKTVPALSWIQYLDSCTFFVDINFDACRVLFTSVLTENTFQINWLDHHTVCVWCFRGPFSVFVNAHIILQRRQASTCLGPCACSVGGCLPGQRCILTYCSYLRLLLKGHVSSECILASALGMNSSYPRGYHPTSVWIMLSWCCVL